MAARLFCLRAARNRRGQSSQSAAIVARCCRGWVPGRFRKLLVCFEQTCMTRGAGDSDGPDDGDLRPLSLEPAGPPGTGHFSFSHSLPLPLPLRRDGRRSGRGQRSHGPRGPRADPDAGDVGDRVRGRGRAGAVRRAAPECNEYTDGGEKYLDCQDRGLTNVMPGWPKDIHHLLLSRNKIQVLRDNMFSQFTRLRSLDLQQNHITMVEDGAFAGLSGLTTLLLQHNRLREASEEALLPMPRLAYLRLYDNPWSCGCRLESLVAALRVPSNRNLGNYAKCAEPPGLKGQKLKNLIPETMCVGGEGSAIRAGTGGGGGGGGGTGGPVDMDPPKVVNTLCRTYMFPRPCTVLLENGPSTDPPTHPPTTTSQSVSGFSAESDGKGIFAYFPNNYFFSPSSSSSSSYSSSSSSFFCRLFESVLYLRRCKGPLCLGVDGPAFEFLSSSSSFSSSSSSSSSPLPFPA
ncbi:hypothetical protein CRUP_010125 [Coryphaenoides rupestris]|nr:hypothetical protein CRUP_010125 [Coryphaenoides rupestris]